MSVTVTGAEQLADSPSVSVHVSVTRVLPTPYGPAGLWIQPTRLLSGSKEPSLMDPVAPQVALVVSASGVHRATGVNRYRLL